MIKMRPHISMILIYWAIMFVIAGLVVILVQHNPFQDIGALLVGLLVVMVECFVFIMIFCNLPYFVIEMGELNVKGPSQWGAGWKKVVIPISEFDHISNNKIFGKLGLYYIKSSQGKIITVLGCRPAQYRLLIEALTNKKAIPPAVVLDVPAPSLS
jgi:hypothetical protein